MHRALCISEILREVLLYAAEQCISDANRGSRNVCPWHAHGDEFSSCVSSCMYDIDDNKRRSTPRHRFLRAVALSCKTFSGVALDLLWCVLDSSEPLRDLQKYLISEGVQPDTLDTCKRYCAYTNRIRGVYLAMDASLCDPERNDSPRKRKRTKQYFRLPRLRSVRIDIPPDANFKRSFGLLTNTLVEVSISFVEGRKEWSPERATSYVHSYLRALVDQPFLRKLELDWVPLAPNPAALTCLTRLDALKITMLASITDSLPLLAALHASSIPFIRFCAEPCGMLGPDLDYSRDHLRGPVELYVRGDSSTIHLDQVLEQISAGKNEEELELHLTCEIDYADSRSFADSCSLLSAASAKALVSAMRCPRSTLAVALRAYDMEDPLSDTDDDVFTFSSIQPFLKIRQMTRFEVAANVPFSISDTDVAALTRAWPALEALKVRLYHDTLQGSALLPKRCPTLRSLVAFARNCPRLSSLYIPFRAAIDGVPTDEWPKPGDAQRTLECLTIDGGEVLCGESQRVGVALEELFPHAVVDTQNVFDMASWDYIIEAGVRHKLYNIIR